MINTKLHNLLIEKEMEHKLVQADILNQKERTRLLREKLKSSLFIVGLVFLVLLLLIFLYWLIPTKTFNSKKIAERAIKIECKCTCNDNNEIKMPLKQKVQKDKPATPLKIKKAPKKEEHTGSTYKNGTEYVKQFNKIHKRIWDDGVLVEDKQLEETIEDSREKTKEIIPQIATPNKGQERYNRSK